MWYEQGFILWASQTSLVFKHACVLLLYTASQFASCKWSPWSIYSVCMASRSSKSRLHVAINICKYEVICFCEPILSPLYLKNIRLLEHTITIPNHLRSCCKKTCNTRDTKTCKKEAGVSQSIAAVWNKLEVLSSQSSDMKQLQCLHAAPLGFGTWNRGSRLSSCFLSETKPLSKNYSMCNFRHYIYRFPKRIGMWRLQAQHCWEYKLPIYFIFLCRKYATPFSEDNAVPCSIIIHCSSSLWNNKTALAPFSLCFQKGDYKVRLFLI